MIGRLTGTLYDKTPPRIGLDVQGVGYEIDVSMTTFYALPEIGKQVTILTHLTVREDAHILYGFPVWKNAPLFANSLKSAGLVPVPHWPFSQACRWPILRRRLRYKIRRS